MRRGLFDDLRTATSIKAPHRKRVLALLERPVVPPDNPRETREWCSQLRLPPFAAINLHLDLRDAASSRVCDTAHGHESLSSGLSDHHVNGNRVDHRSCLHPRFSVPSPRHPVTIVRTIRRLD